MNIRQTLAAFISNELLKTDELLEGDENLLADGMVDSLGMLRLVAYIEDVSGIKVPPQDFIIDNFRTLDVLCAYLERSTADNGDA